MLCSTCDSATLRRSLARLRTRFGRVWRRRRRCWCAHARLGRSRCRPTAKPISCVIFCSNFVPLLYSHVWLAFAIVFLSRHMHRSRVRWAISGTSTSVGSTTRSRSGALLVRSHSRRCLSLSPSMSILQRVAIRCHFCVLYRSVFLIACQCVSTRSATSALPTPPPVNDRHHSRFDSEAKSYSSSAYWVYVVFFTFRLVGATVLSAVGISIRLTIE